MSPNIQKTIIFLYGQVVYVLNTGYPFWQVSLMESEAQRLRKRLELRGENQILHSIDENAALSQEIQLLQEQINENPQLTQFALENKRLIEELTT